MNTLPPMYHALVGIPAWNAIDVFDGSRWLSDTSQGYQLQEYRQVIDMRTGAARTSYSWSSGTTQTKVELETFVSRADQHLAGTKLVLTPEEDWAASGAFCACWLASSETPCAGTADTSRAGVGAGVAMVPRSDSGPVPCGRARSCRCPAVHDV